MSFMQPVVFKDAAFVVETSFGTEYVPESVVGKMAGQSDLVDYVDGVINSVEYEENKWFCQLSASGYMDQTELSCHEDEMSCWMDLLERYPEAFTWAVEHSAESPTAHIQMPTTTAAEALVVTVQSIGGSSLEKDGSFVYAAISDSQEADKELMESGFSTQEAA